MKKKYMVRCDIEGVTGVVSYEQSEPGKSEYAFAQKMFMGELISLLEGLHDGGAERIVIYDEHYYGRNIDLAELPEYAHAICGKPPFLSDWAGGLDASFSGVILLGFHSKAGTPDALLPHTYEHDIKDLRLNGVSIGEIGMEAAIAGDFNVSVQLVTGDSHGIEEARSLLEGVECVTVKEGFNETGALCYPLRLTTGKIRTAARKIVENPPPVKPYTCGGNAILEVQLHDTPFSRAMQKLYFRQMDDSNTITIKGKTATEVWAQYWNKKLECLAQGGDVQE
ncbi:M55 family metallopeptidase [Candidatus Latescibacterota bacterium]